MGKSSGSIWVSLGLRTANFSKGISKAKKDLNGFQKFGKGLKGMFNPMSVGIGVVAGLGAVLSDAVGIFKDFEKANSDLEAVLGATDKEMESLIKQSKILGSTTAFTATEVSGLQKEFAKLGFDTTQIKNMTEATLNLAAAAGVELAEAASFAGSTLNAFGLDSQNAGHITDVMALSFASSALDMENLSEVMKNAAPIARATGVSFEVATAAAGKLADANITGSKAGTDLRKIFSILVKDGKPFAESLNDIASEMDGASTKAEKLGIAEKLVGERAKGALLVLVDQKDALGELATELENADGAAKKMADTMLDNLTGDMTIAKSAWEGLVLSLEDGSGVIGGALRNVVQGFTSLITGLKNLDLIWKDTFEGMSKFSNEELSRSLQGGWVTEFGVNISKISNEFDKIPLDKMTKNIDKVKESWIELLGEDRQNAVLLFNQYLRERIATENELVKSSKSAAKATKEDKDEVVLLTAEQIKAAKAISNTQKKIDSFAASLLAVDYSEMGTGEDIFADADDIFDKITADFDAQAPKLELPITFIPPTSEEEEALFARLDLLKAQADAVGGAVSGAFANMSNSMVESLGLASTGLEGFLGGMLKTVVSLISMMLASSISQAIAGATASGSATGPAAVFSTPAFIATAVGGVLGAFAAIPAFAEGVTNFSGGTALVGELGPELVNLPRGSDVIPNNKLGGLGGGMDGHVEFIIKGTNLVGVLKRTGKTSSFSN